MIKIADTYHATVNRAAYALAELCLPDASVIDASEEPREAAKSALQYWRDEAAKIGETLQGVPVEDADESIEHALYAATLDAIAERIESARA